MIQDVVEKTDEKLAEGFQQLQGKTIAETETQSHHKNKIDWAAIRTQLEQPILNKDIRLSLPLDLTIEQIDITNVSVAQKSQANQEHWADSIPLLNVESLQIEAQAKDQLVSLQRLDLKSDLGDLSATGTLSLKDNYPLNWQLEGIAAKQANVELPFSYINANLSGALYDKTIINLKTGGRLMLG